VSSKYFHLCFRLRNCCCIIETLIILQWLCCFFFFYSITQSHYTVLPPSLPPSDRYTPETCEYPACSDDPVLCPGAMVCEPVDKQILDQLELTCLIIFVFDYGIRILTCAFIPGRSVPLYCFIALYCSLLSSLFLEPTSMYNVHVVFIMLLLLLLWAMNGVTMGPLLLFAHKQIHTYTHKCTHKL
jgi:hypothetical protein